jgi:hypothetical protein
VYSAEGGVPRSFGGVGVKRRAGWYHHRCGLSSGTGADGREAVHAAGHDQQTMGTRVQGAPHQSRRRPRPSCTSPRCRCTCKDGDSKHAAARSISALCGGRVHRAWKAIASGRGTSSLSLAAISGSGMDSPNGEHHKAVGIVGQERLSGICARKRMGMAGAAGVRPAFVLCVLC